MAQRGLSTEDYTGQSRESHRQRLDLTYRGEISLTFYRILYISVRVMPVGTI